VSASGLEQFLDAHCERFNRGVESGDFSDMVSYFADDAVLEFEGVPAGPFVGRDAIAEAYRSHT
jgi:steroid Delta-isomerase